MITSTFQKTTAAYNNAESVKTIRRVRRAYLGLHGFAFDFAVKRAKKRLDQVLDITDMLVAKGETVEAEAGEAFTAAKEKAADLMPKAKKPIKKAKAKMKTERTVAKKPASSKAAPKKAKAAAKPKPIKTEITAKPEAAPKTSVEKAEIKKEAVKKVEAAKVPAKNTETIEKAAAVVAADVADKYDAYVADVLRYDATADAKIVKKIVDHLGIALESRDGKFVACTDEAERATVRESWLKKKLGLESVDEDLDARVMTICDLMAADRFKNRVTFYYLLAKEDGKLASL